MVLSKIAKDDLESIRKKLKTDLPLDKVEKEIIDEALLDMLLFGKKKVDQIFELKSI